MRRVLLRNSYVEAQVAGEATPRRFERVDATLRLGRGYTSIDLDLHGIQSQLCLPLHYGLRSTTKALSKCTSNFYTSWTCPSLRSKFDFLGVREARVPVLETQKARTRAGPHSACFVVLQNSDCIAYEVLPATNEALRM